VECAVGGIVGADIGAAHVVERRGQGGQLHLVVARGRHARRTRLDQPAQLDHQPGDLRIRVARHQPGQHVRVEQVPV